MSTTRWDWRSRRTLLLVMLSGMLACSSDGIATVPVAGTVTYKGQPLENGQIQFLPVDGPAAVGSIENGKFTLSTNAVSNGAPPGKYRVTVFSYKETPTKFGESTTKSVVPTKYTNPDTSGLVVDVPPEGNSAIDIKLVD